MKTYHYQSFWTNSTYFNHFGGTYFVQIIAIKYVHPFTRNHFFLHHSFPKMIGIDAIKFTTFKIVHIILSKKFKIVVKDLNSLSLVR